MASYQTTLVLVTGAAWDMYFFNERQRAVWGAGNNRDMEGECTKRYDAFIQMTVVHTSVKGIKTMGNYLQFKDQM